MENPPRTNMAEGKKGNVWLVATLHIVPQDRKSNKGGKDNWEKKDV